MKISLKNVPVVDVHCHPYEANKEPYTIDEFVQTLSLAVIPNKIPDGYVRKDHDPYYGTNMWVQILMKRLANYYSCEPRLEAVVAERNARANDFGKYTRELFDDANLSGLIADFGYPSPMLSRKSYIELCGSRVWEIHRIEPVMVSLRQECATFGDFAQRYRHELRGALKRSDVVGLKSIIAYRSGLEISAMKEEEATAEYSEFQNNERAQVKALRDYCLHIAMEECTQAGKVMHIHTGSGMERLFFRKQAQAFY
jgi:hypothetical protein